MNQHIKKKLCISLGLALMSTTTSLAAVSQNQLNNQNISINISETTKDTIIGIESSQSDFSYLTPYLFSSNNELLISGINHELQSLMANAMTLSHEVEHEIKEIALNDNKLILHDTIANDISLIATSVLSNELESNHWGKLSLNRNTLSIKNSSLSSQPLPLQVTSAAVYISTFDDATFASHFEMNNNTIEIDQTAISNFTMLMPVFFLGKVKNGLDTNKLYFNNNHLEISNSNVTNIAGISSVMFTPIYNSYEDHTKFDAQINNNSIILENNTIISDRLFPITASLTELANLRNNNEINIQQNNNSLTLKKQLH